MIKYYLMDVVGNVRSICPKYLELLNTDTSAAAAYLEFSSSTSEEFEEVIYAYYYHLLKDAYLHYNVNNLEALKAAVREEGLPVGWVEWVEDRGEEFLSKHRRKFMRKGQAEAIIRFVFRQTYSLIKENTDKRQITIAIRSVGYDQRWNICQVLKEHFPDYNKVMIRYGKLDGVSSFRVSSQQAVEDRLSSHTLHYIAPAGTYELRKQLQAHLSQPLNIDKIFTDLGHSSQEIFSALDVMRYLEAGIVNIDAGKAVS